MAAEYRTIPIHKALTRQQLIMGCDRDLFFMMLLLVGLLVMSSMMAGTFRNVIFAVVLWMVGTPILAKLAKYDPYFSSVVARSVRYLKAELPANGRVGLPPMIYKRWD